MDTSTVVVYGVFEKDILIGLYREAERAKSVALQQLRNDRPVAESTKDSRRLYIRYIGIDIFTDKQTWYSVRELYVN